jgi:hypothetical protein
MLLILFPAEVDLSLAFVIAVEPIFLHGHRYFFQARDEVTDRVLLTRRRNS